MKCRLVFTANDRPYYFGPVMMTWRHVRGYADWEPTVFLEPSAVAENMTAIALIAEAAVHLNPHRRGVLSNPWHALDTAFGDGADFVVLAEDDILPSDDALEYFTWAANEFSGEHILAVRACSFADDCPPEQAHEVYRTNEFCPLLWGTWKDRWTDVLRDTWDHDYSSGTPQQPQSGWDWNINLRVMTDWNVITPVASRATHIGERAGTHTTSQSFPGTVAHTFREDRPPAPFHLRPDR